MFRKGWESNEGNCLDKVMTEFANKSTKTVVTEEVAEEATE